MQIDYSSVVIFPDSMAIGRIVHYNFSVSLPGNHGYGLTIVFLLYEQIDVVMYSCFSAYKCIDTPTAVQKHLYRCFRQHFKNLTCIKISDHKISIYQYNPLLLRTDLPSHPPDPVIEVVADDAELPYLRGVAHVRSYAGAVIVIAYADYAKCLRSVFREFAQVHD